jgi:hypothetical protein
MKIQHIALFTVTMAAVLACLAGVILLFWNAFQAAKRGVPQTTPEFAGDAIRWTEGGALNFLAKKTLGRVNQVIAGFRVKALPQNALPTMDPVDGTAFQEGDSIARCVCGTNYHLHSWQWLMEQADGRCVNCKRLAAVQQRVLA